jgi:predicted alpha/beta superfamily hydrolase
MDTRLGVLVASLALPTVAGAGPDVRPVEVRSAVFANTRTLSVLVPPGYDEPANRSRRYPVVYFTDGIAAFDAWGVTEVAAELWRAQRIPQAIFVAIPNGGSVAGSASPLVDRANEYLPYDDPTWEGEPRPVPKGDRFPAFLFDEVMPAVRRAVRVTDEPSQTCLAGASYGAVAVIHAAIRRPGAAGCLLIESPSLHVGRGRLMQEVASNGRWPARVYVGVGTAEGESDRDRREMVDGARALFRHVASASDSERRLLVVQPGGTHWFDTWRHRLPRALELLLAE